LKLRQAKRFATIVARLTQHKRFVPDGTHPNSAFGRLQIRSERYLFPADRKGEENNGTKRLRNSERTEKKVI